MYALKKVPLNFNVVPYRLNIICTMLRVYFIKLRKYTLFENGDYAHNRDMKLLFKYFCKTHKHN
jgi:hypothetical protein